MTETKEPPTAAQGFAPAALDIEQLTTGTAAAPDQLIKAAHLLMELCQQGQPERFGASFSDTSRGAAKTRAIFRLCRGALDFLEAAYLAEEAEQLAFYRSEVAKLEALQNDPISFEA